MTHTKMTIMTFYLISHFAFLSLFSRPPNVVLNRFNYPSGQEIVDAWRSEAAARYPANEFAFVFVHGLTKSGQWYAFPDYCNPLPVETLLQLLRLRPSFWGRRIVLICCNGGGHKLSLPRVSYGQEVMWIFPDSSLSANSHRDSWEPEVIGDIDEFTENH